MEGSRSLVAGVDQHDGGLVFDVKRVLMVLVIPSSLNPVRRYLVTLLALAASTNSATVDEVFTKPWYLAR